MYFLKFGKINKEKYIKKEEEPVYEENDVDYGFADINESSDHDINQTHYQNTIETHSTQYDKFSRTNVR